MRVTAVTLDLEKLPASAYGRDCNAELYPILELILLQLACYIKIPVTSFVSGVQTYVTTDRYELIINGLNGVRMSSQSCNVAHSL